jgi:uncharacterized protein (TIGR04255 family)
MSEQPYARPPITEAVVEIRFGAPVDQQVLEKVSSALHDEYPHQQPIQNFEVEFNVVAGSGNPPTTRLNETAGLKRMSQEMTELLILWPSTFLMSQLAPYPGWDNFLARFVHDWKAWKRIAGYQKLVRVGLRFVNRVDVPIDANVTESSHYLTFSADIPPKLGPVAAYAVQAQFPPDHNGLKVTLNSGLIPSPLPDRISLLLDQDIALEQDVPQRDDEIVSLLGAMREKKNLVFEVCITDRARGLFN